MPVRNHPSTSPPCCAAASDSLGTSSAVSGGGTSSDYMQAVAVDGAGTAVAAGYFSSSSATFGGVALTSAGSNDAVLWRMNAEGTTMWAVRGGGTSNDYLYGVAVYNSNAVVATGSFYSSATTFGGVSLTNAGRYDAVVWMLSGEGTTLWAVRGGGTSSDYMRAVAVDGAGAVLAAGYFQSSPASFGGVVLNNAGSDDAVLWKLNGEGTTLWAVRGGGTSSDYLYGVAVDGAGSVVAVGYYYGSTSTFGDVALTNTRSDNDAVLWKVNAQGSTLWAVNGGGASDAYLKGVAVDNANAVVAAGYFSGSQSTFGNVALTNTGYQNAILWKMNVEGTTLWAVRGGGTRDAFLYGVAAANANDVVAAGYFSGTSATFGDVALTNSGTEYTSDAVLWKVTAEGTTQWAVRVGGTGYSDKLYGVAVDYSNTVVAAGIFDSSPATFEGVNLTNTGGYDAVVWKVFNTLQPPAPPPAPMPPPSPPSPPPLPPAPPPLSGTRL